MPTTLPGQPIDERTPALELPLPHIDNWHEDDVPRLRAALGLLDVVVHLLSQDVGTKASQDELAALANSLNGALAFKASQSEFTLFQGSVADALALKASTEALSAAVGELNTAIAARAPKQTPTITGLREVRVALGAGVQIDVAAGNLFTKTIAGPTALTVANVPAAGTVACFLVELTNGGSAAVTWWPGCKWPGGVAPALTTAGRDLLGFVTHDGGASWTGMRLAKDAK